MLRYCLVLFLSTFIIDGFSQSRFVEDIDGNKYPVKKIGDLYWMLSNLKTTRLNDGTPIPTYAITDCQHESLNYEYHTARTSSKKININGWNGLNKPASLAYDNNPLNVKIYGYLYNYEAAKSKKLCPTGWRLAKQEEWQKLTDQFLNDVNNWDTLNTFLNTKYGWNEFYDLNSFGDSIYVAPGGKNITGFSALPGGGFFNTHDEAHFSRKGENAFFWVDYDKDNHYKNVAYTGYDGYFGPDHSTIDYMLYTVDDKAFSARCVCERLENIELQDSKLSKKEQIEYLENRIKKMEKREFKETLQNLENLAELNLAGENAIIPVNEKVIELKNKVNQISFEKEELEKQVVKIKSENSNVKNDNAELKKQLEAKETEIATLKQNNTQNQVATNNTNTSTQNNQTTPTNANTSTNSQNSTNSITQTGNYKSVKIGTQTWMVENLNVSTFRNGDPIPEAKTNEEWEKAGKNKQPAWCYYDNDPKNGAKYGKLYNWYAVSDPRGLPPAGWHVPSNNEWTILSDFLGNDAGKKMKSTSGWDSWQENLTCQNCLNWNDTYRSNKRGCDVCQDTKLNGKKTHFGNGTNSSGFSGLPVGERWIGGFTNFGEICIWWSSVEYNSNSIYHCKLVNRYNIIFQDFSSKYDGNYVRCLKD
jgi:uncharacterized protein (TIGR02145 family)